MLVLLAGGQNKVSRGGAGKLGWAGGNRKLACRLANLDGFLHWIRLPGLLGCMGDG
jgi:hypothetical protein